MSTPGGETPRDLTLRAHDAAGPGASGTDAGTDVGPDAGTDRIAGASPLRARPTLVPPAGDRSADGDRQAPPDPRLAYSTRPSSASRGNALVRWVRTSFLPEAPVRPAPPAALQLLYVLLFLAASTALLLFWRAEPGPNELIWAEDGTVFLRDALTGSWAGNVLTPYAGYMHLVPRTIAELVPLFPADQWALVLTAASALTRALLAVFVFYACAGVLPGRVARGAIAIVVVTVPLGAFEVLNSIANLHWFLMIAAVPALLWRPRSWFGVLAQCAVVAASMLSDPLTLIWTPLLLLRLVGLRTVREQLVSLTFVLSTAVQLVAVSSASRESGPGIDLGRGTLTYLIRVLEASTAGFRWTTEDYRGTTTTLMWVCLGIVLLVLAAGLSRPGPHRGFIVLCVGASAGFYGVTLYFFPDPTSFLPPGPDLYLENASRYQVPAAVLLLAALVAAGSGVLSSVRGRPGAVLDPRRRGVPDGESNRSSPTGVDATGPDADGPTIAGSTSGGARDAGEPVSSGRRTAGGVLTGVFALAGAFYLFTIVQVYAYDKPQQIDWDQALAQAEQTCRTEQVRATTVAIDPAGWTVDVPCETLP